MLRVADDRVATLAKNETNWPQRSGEALAMMEGQQNLNSAKPWGSLWILGTTRPFNLIAHLWRGGATLPANWRWFTSQRGLHHEQIYFGKGGNGFKAYCSFRTSNSLWESERPSTLLQWKASLHCIMHWTLDFKQQQQQKKRDAAACDTFIIHDPCTSTEGDKTKWVWRGIPWSTSKNMPEWSTS